GQATISARHRPNGRFRRSASAPAAGSRARTGQRDAQAFLALASAAIMLSQAWSAVILPCRHAVSSTFMRSLQRGYQGWETAGTASEKLAALPQMFRRVGTSAHLAQPFLSTSLSITD